MPTKSISITLLTAVINSVERIGEDGTVMLLKKSGGAGVDLSDPKVAFVFEMVSAGCEIPVDKILDSGRSIKKNIAFALTVYYLRKSGYTFESLSQIMNRDPALLCRVNKRVDMSLLNDNNVYRKHISQFDKKITNYLKSTK